MGFGPHNTPMPSGSWPKLPHREWGDVLATLHRKFQIVGKLRVQLCPWINHSWGTSLYLTARGLTTGPMPYASRDLQVDFDFIDHVLLVAASDGRTEIIELKPRSIAEFYGLVIDAVRKLECDVAIHSAPNEVPDSVPFAEDTDHRAYDADKARALWEALRNTGRVMTEFRARFIGKVSPVHFFWGAPDLAVTRFSGRPAPQHAGGIPNLPDPIAREAYSHEVCSCGFWPGSADAPDPVFYAYAYPTPDGFSEAKVDPAEAFWHKELGEFVLPYESVRASDDPDEMLHAFFQTTYEAAANLALWDRKNLERPRGFHPSQAAG